MLQKGAVSRKAATQLCFFSFVCQLQVFHYKKSNDLKLEKFPLFCVAHCIWAQKMLTHRCLIVLMN